MVDCEVGCEAESAAHSKGNGARIYDASKGWGEQKRVVQEMVRADRSSKM